MSLACVTGAAGFIGSHLVDALLAAGHDVLGVDDLSTGKPDNLVQATSSPRFRFVRLDVVSDDYRLLVEQARPEVVFHLAAQMDVRRSVADPLFDARTNVLGTVNVLEGAVRAGTTSVVFASSGGTVYGQPSRLPADEDAPLRPAAPYGAAKVAGETYVRTYQELHGLRGTSLALGNVYGPRQDPHGEAGVVSIFARALTSGAPTTIFGDGTSERDYVHVADVVRAMLCCLQPLPGQRYNVGTGRATTVRSLHTLIADAAGAPDAPTTAPPRLGELQAVSLDSSRLERDAGWVPDIALEQGLAETVGWVRRTA